MDPEQSPEQGNRYSIRESLQELWRGVTFFFNRSSETAQAGVNELEAGWREVTETRKRVEELGREVSGTRKRVEDLLDESKITGDLAPAEQALEELKLKTANFDKLLVEMQAPMRAVLGRNFLGVEEWQRGFGVRVGALPPIPGYITAELLNSNCPLHPGQLIKDTHILVLIPKTVDGQPYSALRLEELCAARKGSGARLISGIYNDWKQAAWANASPSVSEWVLIPKSEPNPRGVPEGHHFRSKNIAAQAAVYSHYEADYREAKALEVMTAAVLNDVVNGAPRMLDGLSLIRCVEPSASGGRILVGVFSHSGLEVRDGWEDVGHEYIGCALARKSRS
jgi:hypothetical protein